MGPDAAPAAVPRKHGLGRSRAAVRGHYGLLPSMAGRGAGEGGRKPAGDRAPKRGRSLSGARKHGPANWNRRVARRKAPCIASRQCTHERQRSRRPARHSPTFSGTAKGHRR